MAQQVPGTTLEYVHQDHLTGASLVTDNGGAHRGSTGKGNGEFLLPNMNCGMKWAQCARTLVLCLPVLLISMSCSGDRYQTFVSEDEGPRFSFEYSKRYRVLYDVISSRTAMLEIQRPVNRRMGFPLVHMDIVDSIRGTDDPEAIVELVLSGLRAKVDGFRVIDDRDIIIDGVNAIRIKYFLPGDGGEPNIGGFVVFNHSGRVWYISLLNHEEAEQDEYEALFDHVIETFKFLD